MPKEHRAVHACQMTGRLEVMDCYDMVTTHAARTLGIEEQYGLRWGALRNSSS
ncbi:MAG: hypothetical protein M0Z66_08265 [Thermaerobacter sp.]|nr:hypothetical protein [Thermaerobacter sp.]